MFSYVFILCGALLALTVAYRFISNDIVNPGELVAVGFSISILASLLGLNTWNKQIPSLRVIAIVLVGIFSFIAGGIVFHHCHEYWKRRRCRGSHYKFERRRFEGIYAPKTTLVLIVVVVMVLFERAIELHSMADILGIQDSSLNEIIAAIRLQTDMVFKGQASGPKIGFSFIANQGVKFVIAAGYFSIIEIACILSSVFTSNEVQVKARRATLPAILLTVCVAFNLITGSRGMIINWAVSLLVGCLLIASINGAPKRRVIERVALIVVPCGIIGGLIFYFMAGLVGRGMSVGVVDYLSFYFGAGIPSLEKILSQNGVYGKNFTFNSLCVLLNKFGIGEAANPYSMGWVILGGMGSNVFTGFARYYFDFGLPGVLILGFCAGVISTFLYDRATSGKAGLIFAMYLFLAPYLIDMAREEFIFSRMLSVSFLVTCVILGAIIYMANKEKNNMGCAE